MTKTSSEKVPEKSLLEPAAFSNLGRTHQEQMAISLKSIAISLKRIADHMGCAR
jgi:hypothetical protein